jgi:hypothetical protein
MKSIKCVIILLLISLIFSSFFNAHKHQFKIVVLDNVVTDTLRFKVYNLTNDTLAAAVSLQVFSGERGWVELYPNIYEFNRDFEKGLYFPPKCEIIYSYLTKNFSKKYLNIFPTSKFRLQLINYNKKPPYNVKSVRSNAFKFSFPNQ